MRHPEFAEQKQLVYWCRSHQERYPDLEMLFAIPNSGGYGGKGDDGKTATFKSSMLRAIRAKQSGTEAGYPDLGLDVARPLIHPVTGDNLGWSHGLRIEMKAPGKLNEVSADQLKWRKRLVRQGYTVVTCDSWQAGWNAIVGYLGLSSGLHQRVYPPKPKRKT